MNLTLLSQSPGIHLTLPLCLLTPARSTKAGVLWSSVLRRYLRHCSVVRREGPNVSIDEYQLPNMGAVGTTNF